MLVARCFKQEKDLNYKEEISDVAKYATISLVYALATKFCFVMDQNCSYCNFLWSSRVKNIHETNSWL